MANTFYKIRRRSDGLFSKGGMEPKFSKTGKTWTTKGALSNHFAILTERGSDPSAYNDCEVVEMEAVVKARSLASHHLEEARGRKRKKREERLAKWGRA